MSGTADSKELLDQIVVAEDSTPNRKILCHLLSKLGYDVISCENGKVALDAILSGQNKRIVAVLSDVMMPEMDGLSLLKAIRENETYRQTPVVLITAVSDRDYILQAKTYQVNGYILKPVTFQRVQEKLQELFPRKVFPRFVA